MKCSEVIENLSAYQDGELTDAEAGQVREHLGTCAECRKRLAEYEGVWRLLCEDRDAEPSPGFTEAVLERASGRSFGMLRKPAFWVPAAAVAASLALVCGLLILGSPWSDDTAIAPVPPIQPPEPAITEVEAAVSEDPDLLEILENLDALEHIEVLENLPVLEKLNEVEAVPAEDLAEANDLALDSDLPLEER